MSNVTIQRTGLVLFLLGLGIFLGLFFFSTYRLNKEKAHSLLSNQELISLFDERTLQIASTEYSSSFAFVSDLDAVFNQINQTQLSKYGISENDLSKIIEEWEGKSFNLEIIDHGWDDSAVSAQFKVQRFKEYGGWLDGRTYESAAVLRKDLQNVADNINNYSVINQKGIDRYKAKNLKYELTKASTISPIKDNPLLFMAISFGFTIVGAVLYLLPGIYSIPGIKNNNIFKSSATNVGWIGIVTGTFLILFYILLYYFPEYMTNWIILVDPISMLLKGSEAGRFFLYGFMYTLAILVMGLRMIIKYRGNKYQILRTFSVMFFQTAFAFLIPEILLRLNQPYFDFKNIWPLDYDFFFDNELNNLVANGTLGIFMLGWGIALIVIAVPVFVYFFGKRWYCSWVCGCGGLAETLGDPYRQLSSKKLSAWKIERWSIHGVLVFAILMTVGVLYTYWTGSGQFLGMNTYAIRETYGFWIGAAFAGVVGTGFYPLMGNRVWCRFGCPLAAYLGFIQRFKSRFRITTNGGQCISCGNCSTYCEMGIDVRWYAQRGQNIVRSSCVGCGICSAVCPRGVLKLENGEEQGRFGKAVLIGNDSFKLAD